MAVDAIGSGSRRGRFGGRGSGRAAPQWRKREAVDADEDAAEDQQAEGEGQWRNGRGGGRASLQSRTREPAEEEWTGAEAEVEWAGVEAEGEVQRRNGRRNGRVAPQWRKKEEADAAAVEDESDKAAEAPAPKPTRPPRRRGPPGSAVATAEEPTATGEELAATGAPARAGGGDSPEEDAGARVRLAQQLKVAEQQATQRSAVVARLREDVRRLEAETALAKQSEARHRGEASSLQAHSSSSEEAFRSRRTELLERIRECKRREVDRRGKEREWREELDSMTHQQSTIGEEVAELQRDCGRWRKAASKQAERLVGAEKRLKQLEAQRVDCRAQGAQLRELTEKHQATAEREREMVRELKGRIESVEGGSSRHTLLLQAIVAALWLLALWLLLAD